MWIMNLSFAGCGFLGIYHVGVAVCFKKYAPHLLLGKISGASFGALSACCLLCELPIGKVLNILLVYIFLHLDFWTASDLWLWSWIFWNLFFKSKYVNHWKKNARYWLISNQLPLFAYRDTKPVTSPSKSKKNADQILDNFSKFE